MKQTIKFLRKEAPYASKAAAITGLNSVSHVCGQPVVAFYKYTPTGGSEETRVALAIGLSTGTGAANYRLVADGAELSEYESLLGSYATQLSNHISTLANGSTAGHVKDGGDLTFTNGVGKYKAITSNTILGNKTSSSASPTALTATEVRTILNVENGAQVNQNAFSNVKVGSTTIAADAKQDTLELVADNQITLTPDANNDKVTIALTTNPYLGAATADTADTGTNTTQVATTAFVQTEIANKIAAADAMIYKGTIGTAADGGTVQELPYSTAKTGWTYKVVTAGSYTIAQGKTAACEVGDMIICLTSATQSAGATWTVIQNNIDGAVTGPASSTANHIAAFNNASGKVIKDSGIATNSMVLASGSVTTGHIAAFTGDSTTGAKQISDTNISVTDILTKSDASSTYVPKTISVTGDNGLTGGGTLTDDRVISHATASPDIASTGSLVTGVTADAYGHIAAVTKTDLSTSGTAATGKYVSKVQWNGTNKTQLDVTYTTLPTESGMAKVDASDGAGYLGLKLVSGTANLTGTNNTYACTRELMGSGTTKTIGYTCTIDLIDGGEF